MELRFIDAQHAGPRVNIAKPQAHEFTAPQSG
jgi:hypothetical protein